MPSAGAVAKRYEKSGDRLIVESLLGVNRKADRLHITPCMPEDWKIYSLSYRFADTAYRIAVVRTSVTGAAAIQVTLDGVELAEPGIPLVDDRREHVVEVRINSVH